MSKDLPKPVTRKSSKAKLWEELECARAEIDQQQELIIQYQQQLGSLQSHERAVRAELEHACHCLNVVRAAVSP